MAFQLAEAYVELSQRGFRVVSGAIDGIRSKLGGLVGFASGPLAAAMAGIGGAAAVTGLVSLAASAEQTKTQFKTLLGSVDAAKKTIQDLQAFGAATPFEFEGLASSAKMLLAFGVAQDQIIPTMQALGDIASATGNDIGELSGIFGKVKANGRMMTEELNMLGERGIPIGDTLAKMFGVTAAEVRTMASEGKISFADMQQAMINMTSEGGIAFGGMADQSQTLGGLFSTLKDNVTMFMTEIGEALVEGFDLKTAVAQFSDFVGRVKEDWMPSIVNAFKSMRENIIKPVASALMTIGTYFMDLVSNIDLYWELAYTHIANHMLNATNVVSTFFSNGVTMASWFVTSTAQFFVNLFTRAGEIFPAIGEMIMTFLQNGITLAKWFVTSTITYFGNLYKNAGQIFTSLVEQIKSLWQSVLTFFTTGRLEFDFSPLKTAFNAAVEGIEPPNLKPFDKAALQSSLNAAFAGIEAPKLAQAETNLLGGDIDRINQKILARAEAQKQARLEAEKAAAAEAKASTAKMKIEQAAEKAAEKEEETADSKVESENAVESVRAQNHEKEKRRQASFSGLAELAAKMQQELFGQERGEGAAFGNRAAPAAGQVAGAANENNVMPQIMGNQLAAMNRQERIMANLLNRLTSAGVKLAGGNQGGIALPESVLKFGG